MTTNVEHGKMCKVSFLSRPLISLNVYVVTAAIRQRQRTLMPLQKHHQIQPFNFESHSLKEKKRKRRYKKNISIDLFDLTPANSHPFRILLGCVNTDISWGNATLYYFLDFINNIFLQRRREKNTSENETESNLFEK